MKTQEISHKNSIANAYDKNAPLEIYLPSCEKYLKQVVLPSYDVGTKGQIISE